MKIYKDHEPEFAVAVEELLRRSDVEIQKHDATVRGILAEVRQHGDAALLRYTNQFDKADFTLEDLEVRRDEIDAAYAEVGYTELEALRLAAKNIQRFHARQAQSSWEYTEDGVRLGQMVRPLERVGIYVPGGKAAYPSSVLMNAIPAVVAGVQEIIMVSPCPGGEMRPHCLVAADLAKVTRIFKVGGAQAVAALAYGTALVPKVDKIVGPGNIYVAMAKRMVFGAVDIDMIAGPSEILVIADASARPAFVAADLLSQAEHDEEAIPILVTTSAALAEAVARELEIQKQRLPRGGIIAQSLERCCRIFVVATLERAVELANRIAPEHLELAVDDPAAWAAKVTNAGAIFLGHYTPEAVGDYLAGPNHVLPTGGSARFSSPLGVYDFVKKTSLISYTPEALRKVADACCALAQMENLSAHAQAVKIRLVPPP